MSERSSAHSNPNFLLCLPTLSLRIDLVHPQRAIEFLIIISKPPSNSIRLIGLIESLNLIAIAAIPNQIIARLWDGTATIHIILVPNNSPTILSRRLILSLNPIFMLDITSRKDKQMVLATIVEETRMRMKIFTSKKEAKNMWKAVRHSASKIIFLTTMTYMEKSRISLGKESLKDIQMATNIRKSSRNYWNTKSYRT